MIRFPPVITESERVSDTRNWITNVAHFVCHRSGEIGGFLMVVSVIAFFVYFWNDIFGG